MFMFMFMFMFMCECVIVNQFYEKKLKYFLLFLYLVFPNIKQLTIRFTESCFQNISYIN